VLPPLGHAHPVPAIDTSVRPDGRVSATVTVPLVRLATAWFNTVTVYVAPFCPCVKLPTCELEIPNAALDVLTTHVPIC
jgi:hypothetical protein